MDDPCSSLFVWRSRHLRVFVGEFDEPFLVVVVVVVEEVDGNRVGD